MARIPFVTENDVIESEKAAYDAFVRKRGSRPDAGPYALLLHMPDLAQRMESLRVCIRDGGRSGALRGCAHCRVIADHWADDACGRCRRCNRPTAAAAANQRDGCKHGQGITDVQRSYARSQHGCV